MGEFRKTSSRSCVVWWGAGGPRPAGRLGAASADGSSETGLGGRRRSGGCLAYACSRNGGRDSDHPRGITGMGDPAAVHDDADPRDDSQTATRGRNPRCRRHWTTAEVRTSSMVRSGLPGTAAGTWRARGCDTHACSAFSVTPKEDAKNTMMRLERLLWPPRARSAATSRITYGRVGSQ